MLLALTIITMPSPTDIREQAFQCKHDSLTHTQ